MDFWSRLIGSVKTGKTKSTTSNDPQQRLSRFKRSYSHALQIWHKTNLSSPDPIAVETIQTCLRRMTAALQDDSRAPSPHLCLSFAASSYVYTAVARIAVSLGNEAIINETTALFGTLVDSDEEELLSTDRFAGALVMFVERTIGSNKTIAIGPDAEAEVLELIFGIAAKIRLEPDLLPVWFRNTSTAGQAGEGPGTREDGDEEVASKRKDFPLCHQFVGHVYNEGRAGDFARTGLLYIFEAASHSAELEMWITDSDLPTLLATGLGALYSQLGRKLTIAHPDEGLPLILALSDNKQSSSSAQAESFYSANLQAQLLTFMSYMVFWQDVLEHCQSAEIKQTLIDHFQVFFLQQILYPSLLESSDIDGGSSVAVLTYIWRILDSVDHPDMIHLILSYLLALHDSDGMTDSITRLSPTAEKRRETLFEASKPHTTDASLSPTFFNLVDLILTSVQSRNPETATAAVRLVTTILSKHHRYAVSSLVKTIRVPSPQPLRTVGSLHRDANSLISLAIAVGGIEHVDEGYENSLKDAMSLIEGHACSAKRFNQSLGKPKARPGAKRRSSMMNLSHSDVDTHYIIADDPLLRALCDLLRTFFTNDIETNLGLTNVIAHLASCPYTRLDGWLVPGETKTATERVASPSSQLQEPDSSDAIDADASEQARIDAYKQRLRRPHHKPENLPLVMATLQTLLAELNRAKAHIPEFDFLVASRKRAFQGALEIEAENEARPATPGISTPTRQSLDFSAPDSASTRVSARQSPAPPIKRTSPTPDTTPSAHHTRGRSIASIVGGQRKSGNPASPQRASPLMSPSLRALDGPSRRSSRSPTKGEPPALSPLSASSFPPRDAADLEAAAGPSSPSIAASMETEVFERKVKFHVDESSTAAGSVESEGTETADGQVTTVKEASLTHVLTNVVILQEFILELAAIIQQRASLLDGEILFV